MRRLKEWLYCRRKRHNWVITRFVFGYPDIRCTRCNAYAEHDLYLYLYDDETRGYFHRNVDKYWM